MKRIFSILSTLVVLALLFGPAIPGMVQAALAIPTISIVSVDPGKTVTIRTQNYPANDTFDVLMGKMGTRGVNGTKVDTISSGAGGSLTFTFNIPSALASERQIAIRLQSPKSGYFSYNWFWNTSSAGIPPTGDRTPTPVPTLSVIPTISIVSVDPGKTVTIRTSNYPANDTFDVLMGKMGTHGVNGTKVDTISSGAGGSLTFTFNIPSALASERQIAIRLQSPKSGYFSYNWFWNTSSAGIPPTGDRTPTPVPTLSVIPTISIISVEAGKTVTIRTSNYPANDTFDVLMGKMGTRGVNGTKVDTVSSGAGGSLTFTFNIPSALASERQIAIRLQSPKSGYFSYNWFWNSTSP